ncbi:MAG: hemin uptake protein HemP [Pseudomonadota bacterium]
MSVMRPRPEPARAAPAAPASAGEARPDGPPEHDARSLTGRGGEARLWLDGVPYRLRVTRRGKLILTK